MIQVVTNEEYEVFGYKVRRIFRIDGKVVPIIPTQGIPHHVMVMYGVGYTKDSKCLLFDADYSHGVNDYLLAPEGAIVIIREYSDSKYEYRCGIVKEGSVMKLAEYGPNFTNVEEISCPTTEELSNMHAYLINNGWCIEASHNDWRIMSLIIAKKLYGIEI